MTESRCSSKPEESEEREGFFSRISEDRVWPFEFPFYGSHELHHELVGTVTKMVTIGQDRILFKTLAPDPVYLY